MADSKSREGSVHELTTEDSALKRFDMTEVGNRGGDKVDLELSGEEAFARCLPEMMALPPKKVLRLNLDVYSVAAKAFGVLPRIRELRPEFERVYREFDSTLLDRLHVYVTALLHADGVFRVTTMPASDSEGLLEEGRELRPVLLSCLEACAKHGLVNPERWKHLQKTNGFLGVATDLGILVAIFRSEPVLMQRQGLVGSTDLARGDYISLALLTIAGRRRHRRDNVQEASDMRARAFTLLMRNYERVRVAVQYMRFDQGDADAIAPTLFGKRTSRKQRERRALRVAAAQDESTNDVRAKPQSPGPGAAAGNATSELMIISPTSDPTKLN